MMMQKLHLVIAVLAIGLLAAWPSTAMAPYTAIIIDSGSPYFVPKSATVSTGAPIRWENRITSYNVCYTKLLRLVGRRAGVGGPRNRSRRVRGRLFFGRFADTCCLFNRQKCLLGFAQLFEFAERRKLPEVF